MAVCVDIFSNAVHAVGGLQWPCVAMVARPWRQCHRTTWLSPQRPTGWSTRHRVQSLVCQQAAGIRTWRHCAVFVFWPQLLATYHNILQLHVYVDNVNVCVLHVLDQYIVLSSHFLSYYIYSRILFFLGKNCWLSRGDTAARHHHRSQSRRSRKLVYTIGKSRKITLWCVLDVQVIV